MKKVNQSGFTLIELVLTIIVIGIIGSYAAAKVGSSASLTIGQQANQFTNHIRHAQSLAQTWGCQLTFIVNTTSYEVRNKNIVSGKTQCSAANTVVTDPSAKQAFSTTLDYGVQFSSTGTLDFDIKGIPRNSGTNAILTTASTFTMTGGGSSYAISVSHVTGFVNMTGP